MVESEWHKSWIGRIKRKFEDYGFEMAGNKEVFPVDFPEKFLKNKFFSHTTSRGVRPDLIGFFNVERELLAFWYECREEEYKPLNDYDKKLLSLQKGALSNLFKYRYLDDDESDKLYKKAIIVKNVSIAIQFVKTISLKKDLEKIYNLPVRWRLIIIQKFYNYPDEKKLFPTSKVLILKEKYSNENGDFEELYDYSIKERNYNLDDFDKIIKRLEFKYLDSKRSRFYKL